MKLVRAGENTLRISLTPEDLKEYQVTLDDFDYDLPRGKKIIWELFDRAREETGFEAGEEKVYVQLYPKNDGGCELFVIRLEEERECFRFSSLDSFLQGKALLEEGDGILLFKMKNEEKFFMILPGHLTPSRLFEYGERMRTPPSPLYLRARCRWIRNEKDKSDGKRKRST